MAVVCGLDLGQTNDRSAFSAVEHIGGGDTAQFNLRLLERFKVGMSYPDQVKRVSDLMLMPQLREAVLVVDQTGVGRPVVDMFRAAGLPVVAVTITGGDTVTHAGMDWRVPKRDLVTSALTLMQSKRFKVARALAETETFVKELLNFRVKINLKTAHDSYEAWREGDHDDLVLSVSLACWFAQHGALPFGWMDDQEEDEPLDDRLKTFVKQMTD